MPRESCPLHVDKQWGAGEMYSTPALSRPRGNRHGGVHLRPTPGGTRTINKELKRRSAIEPEIGHMKNDGHLGRCYLKGRVGDAMNLLLAACGHNLR